MYERVREYMSRTFSASTKRKIIFSIIFDNEFVYQQTLSGGLLGANS